MTKLFIHPRNNKYQEDKKMNFMGRDSSTLTADRINKIRIPKHLSFLTENIQLKLKLKVEKKY